MYYPNKKIITMRVTKQNMVNYCYMVFDSATLDAVLIDPAWEMDTILSTLDQYNVNLKKILITHHHNDHINLAAPLSQHFNVPIAMSQEEVDCYKVALPNLETFSPESTFINAGSIYIQLLATPGHTLGSTCFLIENMLFTGDTLFNEGCGLCLGKGASPHSMYDSLNMLKRCLNNDTSIYPGHRYATDLGQPFSELLKYNIYLCMPDKKMFIRHRMKKTKKSMFDFI